jgi:hypothetical protein
MLIFTIIIYFSIVFALYTFSENYIYGKLNYVRMTNDDSIIYFIKKSTIYYYYLIIFFTRLDKYNDQALI